MTSALPPANLFSGLPEPLWTELFANARPIKLSADKKFFNAGDPGDGCYMIDGAPRSTSVTAVRDSALHFVRSADFHAFIDRNPNACRPILTVLAKRLRDTNRVVAAASFLTLKGPVARALIVLADAFGKDVDNGRIVIRQNVGQSDLAAMAGIARENVSRIPTEWKRSGTVTRISAYYCLEDRAAIEREAEL